MLNSLQVRNFAIIDQVEVEFGDGMTVLTGETGAGKSILVDALSLVLGERGGAGIVRQGASRAEFNAEFAIAGLPAVGAWLEAQALDSDGECMLRRVVSAEGRSRAFINGNAVSLQTLKALGEMLLDIHGQHFHQSLSKPAIQRQLLDHYAGCDELAADVASLYATWHALSTELKALHDQDADRASRIDLLSFQCQELQTLDLQDGELEALLHERTRFQHSGKLAEGVTGALQAIYENEAGSAHSLIADALRSVAELNDLDDSLAPVVEMLQDAEIQVGEAADTLRRYGDGLDMDPAERDRVEERLDAIQSIARKHRREAAELPQLLDQLQRQLAELQTAEQRGDELEQAVAEAESNYATAAKKLSAQRVTGAVRFSEEVTATMADLGMAGGTFAVQVTPRETSEGNASGIDAVEFNISANPGQPLLPLSRVASGGELSRMSLSIQVIASDGSAIQTMIFDEVDSGVGGGVAEMVGKRLSELGRTRQVLCVTHLPQVASLAAHHFRVLKMTDGKSTRTGISQLTTAERIEELARMLGGVEITARTRAHAREMLEKAAVGRQEATG